MTTDEFVRACFEEKERYINDCFNSEKLKSSMLIQQLNLSKEKQQVLKQLLDTVLLDTYYTLMLTLDGCTTLGNLPQQNYKLFDSDNVELVKSGDMEAKAYEIFYEHR